MTHLNAIFTALAGLLPAVVSRDILNANLPKYYASNIRSTITSRQAYTWGEIKNLLNACKDIIHKDRIGCWNGTDSEVLAAALIIFAIYTINNLAPLLLITKNSLHQHPADPKR